MAHEPGRCVRLASIALAAWLAMPAGAAAQRGHTFAGQRLDEAIRALQAGGLRVVFTSQVVTPDMRVLEPPSARAPRDVLDQLLTPHGLVARPGPMGILLVTRRPTAPWAGRRAEEGPRPGRQLPRPAALLGDPAYAERIEVIAPLAPADDAIGADRTLGATTLDAFGGQLADDPLRVVQSLPGVTVSDDFSSELSARGSAHRHAAIVLDGVEAPWLRHGAFGRGDTGSLTMVRGELLGAAILQVGAYPRRDGGQIGPQVALTLREGSRTAPGIRVGASAASTTVAAEGPLGPSGRGSWLLGLRQGHGEWPMGRDERGPVFGYADLQAKLVYDPRPAHQVILSAVAGHAALEREDPGQRPRARGRSDSGLAILAWRYAIGDGTVVTQRVFVQGRRALDSDPADGPARSGTDRDAGYVLQAMRVFDSGVVDFGVHVDRRSGARQAGEAPGTSVSWLQRAAYASWQRRIARSLTTETGLRLAHSTFAGRYGLDRWLTVEWSPRAAWRFSASTGVMHQFPVPEPAAGWIAPPALKPERASYLDLGVSRQWSETVRCNVTLYARGERDGLWPSPPEPEADGTGSASRSGAPVENGLVGRAYGVELAVQRRAASGFSGWVGYAWGITRQRDRVRQADVGPDLDRTHAVVVSGTARLPAKVLGGFTLRAGSGLPVPGSFAAPDRRVASGRRRDQVRLPAYARLDARVERRFGRHLVAFAEVVNVTNRTNLRPIVGTRSGGPGEAGGLAEPLFPRLFTAGVRLGLGSARHQR